MCILICVQLTSKVNYVKENDSSHRSNPRKPQFSCKNDKQIKANYCSMNHRFDRLIINKSYKGDLHEIRHYCCIPIPILPSHRRMCQRLQKSGRSSAINWQKLIQPLLRGKHANVLLIAANSFVERKVHSPIKKQACFEKALTRLIVLT